jgi:serine/threonine protein kinase
MSDICDTLESINIFHNDIRKRNILVQGKQLYLIDFGYANKKISYPYFNIQKNQIVSSTSIFDLLNKVKLEGKKKVIMALREHEYYKQKHHHDQ